MGMFETERTASSQSLPRKVLAVLMSIVLVVGLNPIAKADKAYAQGVTTANVDVTEENAEGSEGETAVNVAQVTHVENGTTTSTPYTDLQTAVNSATDGDTVTLLDDVTIAGEGTFANPVLKIDKAITLEGASHSVTMKTTTTDESAYGVKVSASVNFHNVKFYRSSESTTQSGKRYFYGVLISSGNHDVTLDGTTIDMKYDGTDSAYRYALYSATNSKLTIKGDSYLNAKYAINVAGTGADVKLEASTASSGWAALAFHGINNKVTVDHCKLESRNDYNGTWNLYAAIWFSGKPNMGYGNDVTVTNSTVKVDALGGQYSDQGITGAYGDASLTDMFANEDAFKAAMNHVTLGEGNTIDLTEGDKGAKAIFEYSDIDLKITGGSFNRDPKAGAFEYSAYGTDGTSTYSSKVANGTKSYVVPGCKVTQEDGRYVVSEDTENYKAKIGSMYYETLAAAVAAARDGDTVTLLNDTELGATTVGKSITFDLGGKTLTITENAGLTFESGSSTIKNGKIDSSKDDIVKAIGSGAQVTLGEDLSVNCSSSVLWATESGKIIVDGATVVSASTQYAGAFAEKGGSIDIAGGSISQSTANKVTVSLEGATSTISGGTVYSGASTPFAAKAGSVVTMTGGKVWTDISDPKFCAFHVNGSGSKLIMSGGEIHSNTGMALAVESGAVAEISEEALIQSDAYIGVLLEGQNNTVNMTGGTIVAPKHYGVYADKGYGTSASGSVATILGGKIQTPYPANYADDGKVVINGGMFSTRPSNVLLGESVDVLANTDEATSAAFPYVVTSEADKDITAAVTAKDAFKAEYDADSKGHVSWDKLFNAMLAYDQVKTSPSYKVADLKSYYESLESIDLSGEDITQSSYGKSSYQGTDAGSLANLVNLKTVNLSNTKIADKPELKALGSLTALTKLETLDVSANEGVADLGGLAENTTLKTLNVSGTSVADLGALANAAELDSLDIAKTKVDNLGILEKTAKVTKLNIAGTPIADLGGLVFAKDLVELDISDTAATQLNVFIDDSNAEAKTPRFAKLTKLTAKGLNLDSIAGLVEVVNTTGYDASGITWDLGTSYLTGEAATDHVARVKDVFNEKGTFTAPTILVAKPTVETAEFAYNGKAQTVLADGTGYTVSDGTKTDAGKYTATATLNSGYAWSDKTFDAATYNWEIIKVANPMEATALKLDALTYSEAAQTITPAQAYKVEKAEGNVTYAKKGESNFDVAENGTITVPVKTAPGEYLLTVTVTAAGTTNYDAKSVDVDLTITVNKADFMKAVVSLPSGELTFTGLPQQPTATVSLDNYNLTSDDYDLKYYSVYVGEDQAKGVIEVDPSGIVNVGDYAVEAIGKGAFKGNTVKAEFKIAQADLANTEILFFDEASNAYVKEYRTVATGSAIAPQIKVMLGNYPLTEEVDYSVTYGDNINPGNGTVTAKEVTLTTIGNNVSPNFKGQQTATFYIADSSKSLNDAKIELTTTEATYNAAPVDAGVKSVKVGETELSANNYAVFYVNADTNEIVVDENGNWCAPTAAGTYKVTVQGKGEYGGTAVAEQQLTIAKFDLANAVMTLDYDSASYDGQAHNAQVASLLFAVEGTAVPESDYQVAFSEGADVVNVGSYDVIVTPKSGNVAGSISKAFTITKATFFDGNLAVELQSSSATYTGSQIPMPVKSVTYKFNDNVEKTLEANQDYTVLYGKNIDAGEKAGRVIVMAKGNYVGAEVVSFNIDPASITQDMIKVADTKYTGSAVTPATVEYNGTKLIEGVDYVLSYENNEKVGTAIVNVVGLYDSSAAVPGNFTGFQSKPFQIEKGTQTISAKNVTKTYGNAAFALGAKLAKGDGTLSYTSDKTSVATVASNGKVTIKGAGTAKITVTASATDNYAEATKTVTVTVKKAAVAAKKQMTVTASGKMKKKPVTVKANKTGTVAKVTKTTGTVTAKQLKNISTNKVAKKFTLSYSKGNIIAKVPKGTKKGVYPLIIKVTDPGNANYASYTKQVTTYIKVG